MIFDLTSITLVWLAGSAILLPLMILAVRLAVIPLVEAIARPRRREGSSDDAERLSRLEERVGNLTRQLEQLTHGGTSARHS